MFQIIVKYIMFFDKASCFLELSVGPYLFVSLKMFVLDVVLFGYVNIVIEWSFEFVNRYFIG